MVATAAKPKPQRYQAKPDGDFIVFHDVPCFKEHTADDGEVYDKQKLEWICANVNKRIHETGDFTPVVVQHTAEPGQPANDPPVIGFAGPYHLALIGNKNPVWAILGDFHIFADDEDAFRKHPRRSVELWVEEDPRDRFFDPISVLGAETPRLDLGMVYSRKNPKLRIRRYAAAAVAAMPSGTNTFAPSGTGLKKPKKLEKEAQTVALSPEEIHQLVDALRSLPEFQYVQEMMKASGGAENGEELSPVEGDGGAGDGDPHEPSDTPFAGEEPPNDAGRGEVDADGDNDGDEAPEKKDVELMRKYAADGDDEGFKKLYAEMDDDRRMKCMAYAMRDAGDGDGDEKIEDNPTGVDKPEPVPPDAEKPEKNKMRNAKPAASQPQTKSATDAELRLQFAKTKRELDDMKTRYSRLEASVSQIQGDKVRAVRYAKLKELESEGYSFNPAEEIEEVAGMDDAAWQKHQERIVKHYQRVPLTGLPHIRPEHIAGEAAKVKETLEESEAVKEIALAKKIPYAKAKAEYRAAKATK